MRAGGAAAAVLVGGGLVLDQLGVAGYRAGFVLVAALLIGAGGALVHQLLRGVPQRLTWLVAYALLALVVTGLLVDRAPLSTGRLRTAADEIDLPFHRLVGEETSGNSRCRPCPALTRRYEGPDVAVEAAVIELASATAAAGYPLELTIEHRRTGRYTTSDGTVTIETSVARASGHTSVVLRLEGTSHRATR